MHIRDEHPHDHPAIALLVETAFGQPDEARLINQLRADGDAAISLVAAEGVAGHVIDVEYQPALIRTHVPIRDGRLI